MSEKVPVVAILNSNDDVVELLRMAFDRPGSWSCPPTWMP